MRTRLTNTPRNLCWGLVCLALAGCGELPDGVTAVSRTAASIKTSTPQGRRFALVPPVRLPVRPGLRSRTQIWVELPADSLIDVASDANAEDLSLVFPEGSVIERVEEVARERQWHIADIRGTTITADGQRYHLLRPDDGDWRSEGAKLWGYAWTHDRSDLDHYAHGAIADGLEAGRGLEDASVDTRRTIASGLRERGDCIRCHGADRPDNLDPRAIVHRGTDKSGFHVPRSVFGGPTPLERYRPHDPNAPSPYLRVTCGEQVATAVERDGARRWVCADGAIPVATYDVASGFRAGDPHAVAVCEGRRQLASFMTDRARRAVAGALSECESKE